MESKKKLPVLFLTLLFILSLVGCGDGKLSSSDSADVILKNINNTYYEVILDYSGTTPKNIGIQYGNVIKKTVPDYEQLVDSYLKEMVDKFFDGNMIFFFNRVKDIKQNLAQNYIDEIDGLASVLSSTNDNILGDGKLSVDELFLLNLLPDVGRATQCSAVAVFGNRSDNQQTKVGRILDWEQGSNDQLVKIQAVVTFKNGNKSICTIGYLGFMGVITGFNDDRVFAAILDSGDKSTYDSKEKRSYSFDLREALETKTNIYDISDYMRASDKKYAYSHLIFLASSTTAIVLENDLSKNRIIRTDTSPLNSGIQWGVQNAIACVNSFVLNGNTDNHTGSNSNSKRWNALRTMLFSQYYLNITQLKNIITYKTGLMPGKTEDGDLYNERTQQIIIFEPYKYNLQVFFRPLNGLPSEPIFTTVNVAF